MFAFRKTIGTRFGRTALGPELIPNVVLALLALGLAVQGARLFWAVLEPIGAVGKWSVPSLTAGSWPKSGGQAFNPFSRAGSGPVVSTVTPLSLKLFGIRLNGQSGIGSAIIATPDGVQSSFTTGDMILPGTTLKRVAFDNVVIDHGGREEVIFIDQSVGQSGGSGSGASAAVAPAAGAPALSLATLQSVVDISPRIKDGRISGLTLSPRGDGAAFRSAGLEGGDVLVSLNGRPINSVVELSSAPTTGELMLLIERGGRTVSVPVKAGP